MSEQTQSSPPETNPTQESSTLSLEPGRAAFRERKRAQLSAGNTQPPAEARDVTPNLNQVIPPQTEPQLDAHQPDLRDQEPEPQFVEPTEGAIPPEELGEPTGIDPDPGVDLLQPDVDSPLPDGTDWQAKYDEAEELRSGMQSDYQRKTQKLADDRRELKRGFDIQTQVSQAYLDQTDRALQQWQGVDWQGLRRTLDPADYNQRVAQYQSVANQVDQAKTNHQQLLDYATKTLDDQKSNEAEVSRDILRNTIPKWGNELYGSLRNYAIDNLGYTASEFDEISDHKMITLLHRDFQRSNAGKTVQQVTRTTNQRAPTGGNLSSRGQDGKFRNTKSAWVANPGERGRARDHFATKLANERDGRR